MSLSSHTRTAFSNDELSALKVWQAPDVSGKKVEDVAIDIAAQPVLTVDEIEAMQKQAYEEGFARGQADGYKVGYEEGHAVGLEAGEVEGIEQGKVKGYNENQYLLQEQVVRFIPLLEALGQPLEVLDEQVEKSLVQLVILIAKHVIQKELQLAPENITEIVRATVKLLPVAQQKISLTLHPDDAALLREGLLLQDDDIKWAINESADITPGGVLVDTAISHIDASIENKLSEIINAILVEADISPEGD